MAEHIRIGVISEFKADFPPHPATNGALQHSASALGVELEVRWLDTESLERLPIEELQRFDAFWCAPGSPYVSLVGALRAVRFAREADRPFIGTCGGFQHVVVEFARNVLGFRDAQHAEYDPYASNLFITPLSCSLAGQTMTIEIAEGSRAREFYGANKVREKYYCNFGLNPEHQARLDQEGLRVTGFDDSREARIVELPEKRFFVATLFVPQLQSRPEYPHPLITAYLEAALEFSRERTSIQEMSKL